MKSKAIKIITSLIILAALVYLLMFNDNQDIQYIYANF